MHTHPFVRVLALPLALCLLVPLGAGVATAKEESKIQIRLLPPGAGGNGNGMGGQLRGDVRTQLQGAKTQLALRVRGAEPSTDYMLLALDDETSTEGLELAHFTTGSKGQFTGSFDIGKGDGADAPVDPRGHYLVVSDGVNAILAGWLYGAAEDDGPMTKVKELTGLAPDQTTNPSGSAAARYDMRPNGHGKFRVSLRDVPAGDYDLWVDGVLVQSLTPNAGGNAEATFTTKPVHGRSRPHNAKSPLDFDPRRKLVEVKQGDALYFSGPMLAQIEGVNVCTATDSSTPFMMGPGQTQGSGSVTLSVGSDCETEMEVQVEDLPAAMYDLYVDGALVGTLEVTDDGMGHLSGHVVFDPTPDAMGELALDFPLGSGSVVEVFNAGESAPAQTPLLTATLP